MVDHITKTDSVDGPSDEQILGLVVEDQHSTGSNFPPPPGWQASTYFINPLSFEVHKSPRTTDGSAILTFPDIGQSEAAFSPFFQYCLRENACPQIDLAYAHFHTCFPGHTTNSPSLSSDDVSINSMIRALITLVERFEIHRLLAIGVGFGATMLVQLSAKMPKIFSGLVLISPIIFPASYPERLYQGAHNLLGTSLGLGLTRRVKDSFMARWLSSSTREELCGAQSSLEEDLDRRNPINVLRLMYVEAWREDCLPLISKITCRVLLASGKASTLHFHANDALSSFNPKDCTWLDVAEVGSLVHDEAPDRMAAALSLFLQTISGFS